jgi:branched-chain amino acid transport system substrate-binding protein
MAQLRQRQPDAVYDLLDGGVNVDFMRALDSSGLRAGMAVYAPAPAFDRVYLPAMGEAALDTVTVGTWAGDLDNPASHRLVTEFEAEYGRPATTWAADGYDAAALLDAALKATKGRTGDPDVLRLALRNAEFASTRGALRFNTNQAPVLSYLARKVARDAKGRLVNESRGVVVKDWRDRAAAACPMRWEPAPAPATGAAKKPAVPPAH